MSGILGIFIGFVIFVLIVLAIVFHKSLKNFKTIVQQAADARAARKQAEEEAYFKRTSTKHYHEKKEPKFKKDYFKGVEEKTKKDFKQEQRPGQGQKPKQETNTRQTVDTGNGVTIIDDRAKQKADRKIFNDSEGEYVDFVEIDN